MPNNSIEPVPIGSSSRTSSAARLIDCTPGAVHRARERAGAGIGVAGARALVGFMTQLSHTYAHYSILFANKYRGMGHDFDTRTRWPARRPGHPPPGLFAFMRERIGFIRLAGHSTPYLVPAQIPQPNHPQTTPPSQNFSRDRWRDSSDHLYAYVQPARLGRLPYPSTIEGVQP